MMLQRDEMDGKAPQFLRASLDHFFQLNRVVTNRLLQQLAVVNIRAGAVPLNNLSLRISNRYRSRPDPAIGAVFGTQTIFRFETSSRLHRLYPNLSTALDVVRVHVIQPINTVPVDWRSAGMFVKPIADILVMSVALTAENDIRRGAYNGVKFLVLARKFRVKVRQQFCFSRQFLGALRHTVLQIAIQRFELPGLSVKFSEHPDFCAQELLNDRNGNVIHRPVLVSF